MLLPDAGRIVVLGSKEEPIAVRGHAWVDDRRVCETESILLTIREVGGERESTWRGPWEAEFLDTPSASPRGGLLAFAPVLRDAAEDTGGIAVYHVGLDRWKVVEGKRVVSSGPPKWAANGARIPWAETGRLLTLHLRDDAVSALPAEGIADVVGWRDATGVLVTRRVPDGRPHPVLQSLDVASGEFRTVIEDDVSGTVAMRVER